MGSQSSCENANTLQRGSPESLGEWHREPFQRRGRAGPVEQEEAVHLSYRKPFGLHRLDPGIPEGLSKDFHRFNQDKRALLWPRKTSEPGLGPNAGGWVHGDRC